MLHLILLTLPTLLLPSSRPDRGRRAARYGTRALARDVRRHATPTTGRHTAQAVTR